jgi:triosephosphate isomerase
MTDPRRLPRVIGNWKMNLTAAAADALVDGIAASAGGGIACELGVAPPFPYLARVAARLRGTPIRVGAQDVHWEARGAFTGAVSAEMLLDVGASFVLVGHSERRQHFAESDEAVRRKAAAAASAGLDVVVCVGETEAERDAGRALHVVERQVRAALDGLDGGAFARIRLAYEPVWAIGTGRTPTEADIAEVHRAIRSLLGARGAGTPVLYGGSVNAGNAPSILAIPDVDGALVGGASLDAGSFAAIARAAGLPGAGPA